MDRKPEPFSAAESAAVDVSVTCPFCHSTETEPMALFGSQLSTAQYYCRACHTPFEHVKHGDEERGR
jgi:ring-1,2-phenylacetyl-CoA epoxidase subunit PaaD